MLSPLATEILAVCVLSGLGIALLGWAVIWIRRLPFTSIQSTLYWLNYAVVRVLWRVRIEGRLRVPPDQGAVIICNHGSPVDTTFIALTVQRVVRWMVAAEYCSHPAFAWFLRQCEVIPTNRKGIDTTATKTAIRYARQGGLVGLFPEGRLNTTGEFMLPGRLGVAMIALKARVPVVPCYVSGFSYDGPPWGCLLVPAKVRLVIGRPLDISAYYGQENRREVLEELTRRFLVEIARLAGRPDYQPRLARRSRKPLDGIVV